MIDAANLDSDHPEAQLRTHQGHLGGRPRDSYILYQSSEGGASNWNDNMRRRNQQVLQNTAGGTQVNQQ